MCALHPALSSLSQEATEPPGPVSLTSNEVFVEMIQVPLNKKSLELSLEVLLYSALFFFMAWDPHSGRWKSWDPHEGSYPSRGHSQLSGPRMVSLSSTLRGLNISHSPLKRSPWLSQAEVRVIEKGLL